MTRIKRLPKGYREKVKEAKKVILKLIENFEKSNMGFDGNVLWLRSIVDMEGIPVYQDIQTYQHEGIFHLSFDYKFIGLEILYDPRTKKYKLFESCVVFIDGTDNFVDNYKW